MHHITKHQVYVSLLSQSSHNHIQEIRAACHAAGIPASLEVLQLDLGDLHSVRSVAAQLNRRFKPRPTQGGRDSTSQHTTSTSSSPPHLDCLICNAGLMAPPTRQVTKDGLEEQFQVCGGMSLSRSGGDGSDGVVLLRVCP